MSEYTVISQQQYEEETGSSGYYEGEASEPHLVGFNDVPGAVESFVHFAENVAVDIGATYFVCQAGTYRIVTMVNGVLDDVEFVGSCPDQNQDFTQPGGGTSGEFQARLEAKVDAVQTAQTEQGGVLDAVKSVGDQIKALAEQIGERVGISSSPEEPGEGEGGCTGAECEIDGGAFAESVDPSQMHTREYAEGVEGIGEALQGATGINGASDLQQFFQNVQPVWPSSAPTCLSWDINVIFIGEIHFEPPCWLWDMLKTFLILSAVIAAWSMMFGTQRGNA